MRFLPYLRRKRKLVILGCDPGTVNCAFSVTEHEKEKITLITSQMVQKTIVSMGQDFTEQMVAFKKFFAHVIDLYQPDEISVELFMQRSFRSNLASPVSAMVTVIAILAHERNIKFNPLMPSSWKRSLKTIITKVDNLYDRTYPVKQRIPDHPVDALLMSIYSRPQGFKCLDYREIERLIQEAKDSTTMQEHIARAAWQEKEKAKARRLKPKKKKRKPRKPKKKSLKVKAPGTKVSRIRAR